MPTSAQRASALRLRPVDAHPRRPLTPPAELAIGLSAGEWRLAIACGVNVLIEGKDAVTESLVSALWRHLRKPIRVWSAGPLPRRSGTLMIWDAATLSIAAQSALLEWLRATGEQRRVVSTSSLPLFPLVEEGLFSQDLYYRLNIIRLDLR